MSLKVISILMLLLLMTACNSTSEEAVEVEVHTKEIVAIEGTISHIAAGAGTSAVVLSTGELWLWGDYLKLTDSPATYAEHMPILGYVVQVCAFGLGGGNYVSSYIMALTEEGVLWGWGANDRAQIGIGTISARIAPRDLTSDATTFVTRTRVPTDTPRVVMDDVVVVSTGAANTIAISRNGDLWIWGENSHGALGVSLTVSRGFTFPTFILGDVVHASSSGSHSLAIRTDGSLWGWGANERLGIGDVGASPQRLRIYYGNVVDFGYRALPEPEPVKIKENVIEALAVGGFSLALTTDNVLYAWGLNTYGQLGLGTEEGIPFPSVAHYPMRVMDNVATISGGVRYAAAITMCGALYMWGFNDSGQVGNGTFDIQPYPVRIMENVAQVSLSGGGSYVHTLALTTDGSLWGWGCNRLGQLGQDPHDLEKSNTPILIRNPEGREQ